MSRSETGDSRRDAVIDAGGQSVVASATGPALRVLTSAIYWHGSNASSFTRAFRRMGHSVATVAPDHYVPGEWSSMPLRAMRRALEPVLVREYTRALIREAEQLRPHIFFVFKGRYVTPDAIRAIRELGAVAINYFPDVSFLAHGKYIPRSLPVYDWVFTSKSFGVTDMRERLGVTNASFLPNGYDQDVHRPMSLGPEDVERYGCDVSFIGTWSPKKQKLLEAVVHALPDVKLRIWGSQWDPARASLGSRIENVHVLGDEYAKALSASKIGLGILSEARLGSSSGDLITSRTFEIPATGALMLHERTSELLDLFDEGTECACFDSAEELIEKIRYFVTNEHIRQDVADAGRRRCESSGYSIYDRAVTVVQKARELRAPLSLKVTP